MKLRRSHVVILFASLLTPVLANVGCGSDDNEGFTTTPPPDSGGGGSNFGDSGASLDSGPGQGSSDSGSTGDSGRGDGGAVDAGPAIYTVRATVDGLAPDAGGAPAQGLVLQNNGGSNLAVTTDGTSQFAQRLSDGAAYAVTVYQRPAGRSCTVEKGSGTVRGANPEPALVHCVPAPTYVIHANVTGLGNGAAQPLVLQNNGGDDLRVLADTQNPNQNNFAHQAGTGDKYQVTISQQPGGRTCTVGADGSGTVGTDVVNVTVTCVPAYTVGGGVQGLTGTNSAVLQNNGGDDVKVTANGAQPVRFTFAKSLENGAAYKVTVLTQPTGQTCTASTDPGTQPAEGKVDDANVDRILFTCTTP